MKKLLLFLSILFLSNINVVKAAEQSAYLSSLSVENYTLSPEFDKYNNTYSVNINNEDSKINIIYETEDESAQVEILNNEFIDQDETTVYINVTNNESKQTYKIIVNKEQEQNVAALNKAALDLSVPKTYNSKVVITCIIIGWLICVFILKKLLFPSKKRTKI